MKTRILALTKYQGLNPNGYFQNLDWLTRWRAYHWLSVFTKRWDHNLPQWRFAILVGQARRLALNPPTSEWGRRMLAARGGRSVQRMYRREGIHPTENATRAHRRKAALREDATERGRLGLPPRPRRGFTV